jgi:serine/threonine-protein kinase
MVEGIQIGTYRLLREIGGGGMGSVWLAEHVSLGRQAALKVLHLEFSNRPDIVTRFLNEARIATAIPDLVAEDARLRLPSDRGVM